MMWGVTGQLGRVCRVSNNELERNRLCENQITHIQVRREKRKKRENNSSKCKQEQDKEKGHQRNTPTVFYSSLFFILVFSSPQKFEQLHSAAYAMKVLRQSIVLNGAKGTVAVLLDLERKEDVMPLQQTPLPWRLYDLWPVSQAMLVTGELEQGFGQLWTVDQT